MNKKRNAIKQEYLSEDTRNYISWLEQELWQFTDVVMHFGRILNLDSYEIAEIKHVLQLSEAAKGNYK